MISGDLSALLTVILFFSYSSGPRKHWTNRGCHRYAVFSINCSSYFLLAPQERKDSRYSLIHSAMKYPNPRTQSTDTHYDVALMLVVSVVDNDNNTHKTSVLKPHIRPETG